MEEKGKQERKDRWIPQGMYWWLQKLLLLKKKKAFCPHPKQTESFLWPYARKCNINSQVEIF